ncbi:MAG: FAD-dependent oxidoreductase [Eubacteriales bacterium]
MKTSYDLIVAGGGLTGVAAATCAARRGLDVLLIEGSGCLGGAISQNLVFPFMRYITTEERDGVKQPLPLSRGLFEEFCGILKQKGQLKKHGCFNPEYVKCVLDSLLSESGADVLFHASLCGVETEAGKIRAVKVGTKAGLLTLCADCFIDATGDGDLMAFAGCDHILGREKDNLCQPMTLCFRVTGVDDAAFEKDFPNITPLYRKFKQEGKIKNIREDVLLFRDLGKGVVHFNSTRIVKHNPVDPVELSRAEIEARRQMVELYEFLKDNFESFRESTLAFSAVSIGVRESRKLVGEYVLTVEDLLACKRFEDSVAVADYDIDIHNPEGEGTSHHFFAPGEYYTIPYRALLPKEYDNLLVAGRCLSATHEAQASVRIMPTCCCLGEAAGVAAALAKQSGCSVKQIDIDALHKMLDENGAKYF